MKRSAGTQCVSPQVRAPPTSASSNRSVLLNRGKPQYYPSPRLNPVWIDLTGAPSGWNIHGLGNVHRAAPVGTARQKCQDSVVPRRNPRTIAASSCPFASSGHPAQSGLRPLAVILTGAERSGRIRLSMPEWTVSEQLLWSMSHQESVTLTRAIVRCRPSHSFDLRILPLRGAGACPERSRRDQDDSRGNPWGLEESLEIGSGTVRD